MLEAEHRRAFGMWQVLFILLLSGGAIASLVAALRGTPPSRLNALAPFGLCAGLDVYCGIAIAVGSLAVTSCALVLRFPFVRQVRRASLMLAASGYAVSVVATLSGLTVSPADRPPARGLWQLKSDVPVTLLSMLLFAVVIGLEFMPHRTLFSSRYGVTLGRAQLVVVFLLLVATVLQQTSLTRTIESEGARASPLWSGHDLPLMFFVSSICGALALLIFVLWRGAIALSFRIPSLLMAQVSRILAAAVFVYLAMRLTSLVERGLTGVALSPTKYGVLFLVEIAAFVLGMLWLSGGETRPQKIQIGALMIVSGLLLNRLNTSITAFEGEAGPYRPNWIEVLIAISLVALGVGAFSVCAKHLPVFIDRKETNS